MTPCKSGIFSGQHATLGSHSRPMNCSAQVWRTAHHRAAKGALGRQTALVHTGFYRAWVANGLHLQVIEHMQVTVAPLPASCPSEMFHLPVVVS